MTSPLTPHDPAPHPRPAAETTPAAHGAERAFAISIVVPAYNVASFLERCLRSLSAQTFKDFEVLLVDDCSTDGTGALCDELARLFDCCTVIHHDRNQGLSAARNTGIAAARGSYLGFVDSDDWVAPTMLETLHRAAEQTGAAISQVAYRLCTKPVDVANPPEQLRVLSGDEALREMLLVEEYAVWFRLYRRELFFPDEEWFPVGLTCEDRVANATLLHRASTVAISNRCEYFYFQNAASISQGGLSARGFDLITADRLMLQRIEAYGDAELAALAEDRAAKSSYSLLVKWFRWGTTDPNLDEEKALETLWADFRKNYARLMKSHLSLPKKAVAWQMAHCPALLRAELTAYRALTRKNVPGDAHD